MSSSFRFKMELREVTNMETETTSIGTAWRESISHPQFNFEENRKVFDQLRASRERLAEQEISRVRSELAAGVSSCIERGSNSLGLEVDASVFGTEALREFERWLHNTDIDYIAERISFDGPHKTTALFLFTPA